MKGGKGYKKKKKSAGTGEPIFIDRQMGQMPARAIRLLGNRNVLCYSNDNILRSCHICGKMKGRVYIEPGDVVLITIRDFSSERVVTDAKTVKLGDIVGKYAPEQYNALKKEEGVNQKIFMKLETSGGFRVEEVGTDFTKVELTLPETGDFEFEHSEESGSEEEAPAAGNKEDRGSRQMAATRTTIDDDVDIDGI